MGSKKRKRHRSSPRQLALKYAYLILPLASLLLPGSLRAYVFVWSLPICWGYTAAYAWRMEKHASVQEKRIKLMARFWRYGYFTLLAPLWLHCRTNAALAIGSIAYGIYTLLIAACGARHFVCGMQDAGHAPMKPYAQLSNKDRRDGIFIGTFFIVMGILLVYVQ